MLIQDYIPSSVPHILLQTWKTKVSCILASISSVFLNTSFISSVTCWSCAMVTAWQWERQPTLGVSIVYFSTVLLFVTSNQIFRKKIFTSSTVPESMQHRSVGLMCTQSSGTYKWTWNFCRNSNVRGSRRKVAFIFYTHQMWDHFQINEYMLFPVLSFVLLYELLPWNNQQRPIDFNKPMQKTMSSLKILPNLSTG